MAELHPAAAGGFATEADAYARGRPDYPDALLEWLRDVLAVGPGTQAVDLGAGTGKFTALLARTGAAVIAIEPVEQMRARLALALPGVAVIGATATATTLADGGTDAVLCAQAFHWFATAVAVDEIHRVLKPGGRLGLVWNVRDESIDWVRRITAIMAPYEGDAPRFHSGAWRRAFQGGQEAFGPLEESVFSHRHVGPVQQVIIDRFLSVSFIAALPPDEKAKVETALRELAATHPALRGRTTVELPYRTHAFRAVRLDRADRRRLRGG